ncbi:hypothetical protein BT69DRAFT_1299360 [Atractiella rhizophila]|nr:hypothetical protein BT69DRAFT_1299360 [Atractiella rhizophila]
MEAKRLPPSLFFFAFALVSRRWVWLEVVVVVGPSSLLWKRKERGLGRPRSRRRFSSFPLVSELNKLLMVKRVVGGSMELRGREAGGVVVIQVRLEDPYPPPPPYHLGLLENSWFASTVEGTLESQPELTILPATKQLLLLQLIAVIETSRTLMATTGVGQVAASTQLPSVEAWRTMKK